MSRRRGLLVAGSIALAVAAVLVLAAVAVAQWSGNWVTSFQVMNLGEDTANVVVEYYDEDGSLVSAASHSYTITVGSALNLYQPSIAGLPDGFKGSAVVSSDQPVAAIGSEQATYTDGSIGNSQYSGFGSADVGTQFFLPNVNRLFGGGQWSSRITIQNTGTDPVEATVTFYNSNATAEFTDTVSLPGYGSTTLTQVDETGLPAGWLGTAVVDADGDVAVVVDVMSGDGRVETYNGFNSGAPTAYLPTLLLAFGGNQWNTSFQVFNVSGSTASITMTYYTTGVDTPTKVVTASLPSYESINRYQPNVDSDLGTGWIGSVVIESTEPVVAVGSQSSGAVGKRLASIYNGAAAGATEGFLPTVLRYFGGSNFVTSFQIMNVGTVSATVTVEYYEPGNSTPVKTVYYDGGVGHEPKIAPYNSVNRYQPTLDADLGSGWQGSVRVTSDQPVVLLGSQNGLNRRGDAAGQYNGIASSP